MKKLAPPAALVILLSGCTVGDATRLDDTGVAGYGGQNVPQLQTRSTPARKPLRPYISRNDAQDRLPAFPTPATTNFSANSASSIADATPRMDPEILADSMDPGEPSETDTTETAASQDGTTGTGTTAASATDAASTDAGSGSPVDAGTSEATAADGGTSTGTTDTADSGAVSTAGDTTASGTTGTTDATGDGGATTSDAGSGTASDGTTDGTSGTGEDASGGAAADGGADTASDGGTASDGADGTSGEATGGDTADAGGAASEVAIPPAEEMPQVGTPEERLRTAADAMDICAQAARARGCGTPGLRHAAGHAAPPAPENFPRIFPASISRRRRRVSPAP